MELARGLGDRRAEVEAFGVLGSVEMDDGHREAAFATYEHALALAREVGDHAALTRSRANLATACVMFGRLEEARGHLESIREDLREHGLRFLEAITTGNLGLTCTYQGELDRAEELFRRGRAIGQEAGAERIDLIGQSNLGLVALDRLRLDEARTHLRACLDRARAAQAAPNFAYAFWYLADTEIRAGRDRDALEVLAEWLDHVRRARDGRSETLALATRTRLPGADVEAAVATFAQHGARLRWRESMDANLRLFQATGRTEHIVEAKRGLDFGLTHSAAHRRPGMARIPLHREIADAAAGAGID
jgi:ATP/maltotriose-dependent transcriptional regulator MalT